MDKSREKVFGEIELARGDIPFRARPAEPVRTRCPLCTETVAVPAAVEPVEVTCPSCGITFKYSKPQKPTSDPAQPRGAMERWLAGEPIQPRATSGPERLWRECRRHPRLSGLAAAVLIGLASVSIVSTLGYWNASARLIEVEEQNLDADRPSQAVEPFASENADLAAQRPPRDVSAARRASQRRAAETEARQRNPQHPDKTAQDRPIPPAYLSAAPDAAS